MEIGHRRNRINARGATLITIMVLLVLAAMIGAAALSTTSTSMKKAGSFRGRTNLENRSENGLNSALLRLDNIANPTISESMTAAELLGKICEAGTCSGTENPSCADGYPGDTGQDLETENVICNFLGTSFQNGRVALVRKENFTDTTTSILYVQLLANVISYDTAGRRRILQGGILMRETPVDPATLGPDDPPNVQLLARNWLND